MIYDRHGPIYDRSLSRAHPYWLQVKFESIFIIFIFSSPSKKDKDSRKRERSASSAKLDKFEVPAAKMARATGADPSRESKFLEESFKKKGHR